MSAAPDIVKVFLGQISQLIPASLKYFPVEQVSQAEEPGRECPPAAQGEQMSLAPMEKVLFGHCSMFSRFSVGL